MPSTFPSYCYLYMNFPLYPTSRTHKFWVRADSSVPLISATHFSHLPSQYSLAWSNLGRIMEPFYWVFSTHSLQKNLGWWMVMEGGGRWFRWPCEEDGKDEGDGGWWRCWWRWLNQWVSVRSRRREKINRRVGKLVMCVACEWILGHR